MGMAIRRAGLGALVGVLAAAAVAAGSAAGATSPGKVFAAQLTPSIKTAFAHKAPKLVLRKVHCTVPKNGTPVRCQARFRDARAGLDAVYTVKATVETSGAIKWATTARVCTHAKTGKKRSCPKVAAARVASTLTPAQVFADQLRTKVEPAFKKQAPQLKLRTLTCALPKNGSVVQCKALFDYPSVHVNVLYAIKATLKQTGVITWTTTSHTCTSTKTGKKLAC